MIDATHLKDHRTAASLPKRGDMPRRIGRTKGGLNSKLHTVCDGKGRLIILLLSEGQMSDHNGALLVLDALPPASHLIADRGYDSAWFGGELEARGISVHDLAPRLPDCRRGAPSPFAFTPLLLPAPYSFASWRLAAASITRAAG